MSIFTLSDKLIKNYAQYVHSSLTIKDDNIREYLEGEALEKGSLWPEALLQLDPA